MNKTVIFAFAIIERPMIPFVNKFGWNSYLAYNPLEKRLYGWDNGNQVTYDVTLVEDS